LLISALVFAGILAGCALRSSVENLGAADGYYPETQIAEKDMAVAKEAAVASTVAEAAVAGQDEGAIPAEELYTQAGSSDAATTQAISTKLIKNGYIQVEVKEGEFNQVFFKVSSLAEKYKGYVSNSQTYSNSEGKMTSGMVILRIEKQNFDAVLNEIKAMGTVLNVSVSVQDVTQEYVDNESRLKNLQAQQERLLGLMEKSFSVKDSIEVQRELSNVEGQIEVIKGRQNYLDNLIAYSTIEVSISEPLPITDTTEGGFIGAVKRGARGALSFLRVATMVLIGISPLLVLAGIILIIVWQSLRARNRRRAKRAAESKEIQKK
jgi:uncharacterized protein YeeX (DUF496 family)